MKRNSIGFAIVGCGRIGRRHASLAKEVGHLRGVCDANEERGTALAADMETAAFDDYPAMLKDLGNGADLISVCTPNGLHAEHTIRAFEAGYHVLCEKPMALSVRDCGEMIKAGERANKRLFVVKQNRYNPPVLHLKSLLDNNRLGRIFSVHLNCFWNRNDAYYENAWRGSKDLDGGILYTQFSHFIDLIYWLIGDIQNVHAFTENFNHRSIEFEDAGVAIMTFQCGAIGTAAFTINSHAKNMEGSLTLFCEKGTIKIGGQYLNEVEYQNIEGLDAADIATGRPANEYGDYQGSMSNHEDVYRNVHDVLTDTASMGTVGFEALKTVEIIDCIYKAAARHALH